MKNTVWLRASYHHQPHEGLVRKLYFSAISALIGLQLMVTVHKYTDYAQQVRQIHSGAFKAIHQKLSLSRCPLAPVAVETTDAADV